MFERHRHDHETDTAGLGAEMTPAGPGSDLDEIAARLTAMPADEFAAQLLTSNFTAELQVASTMTSIQTVNTLADPLMPDDAGDFRKPIPDSYWIVMDMVQEAINVLQRAGIIMERSYTLPDRQTISGYVTTRLGRAVIENGNVAAVLNRLA